MNIEIPNLRQITLDLIAQIPPGRVTTFRAIAEALGDEIASRAVGIVAAEAYNDARIPVHRVVYSNGEIGAPQSARQSRMDAIEQLKSEGVAIEGWRIQNLSHYIFESFRTDQPLKALRVRQNNIASRVVREPLISQFQTAGGVDLSYQNYWTGVGAYVELEIESRALLRTDTSESSLNFPYIPTYLAFRELPVLLNILSVVQEKHPLADIIFVDGTGILHPRQSGIACQLGVLMDVPTIGVTKKKLYGSVATRDMAEGEVRPVIDPEDGQQIGAAIKTSTRAAPIYVSVGHGIDLETAIDLTLKLAVYKLPEPIHRAHLLSKEIAQKNHQPRRFRERSFFDKM